MPFSAKARHRGADPVDAWRGFPFDAILTKSFKQGDSGAMPQQAGEDT